MKVGIDVQIHALPVIDGAFADVPQGASGVITPGQFLIDGIPLVLGYCCHIVISYRCGKPVVEGLGVVEVLVVAIGEC